MSVAVSIPSGLITPIEEVSVVPLIEGLALPDELRAKANPKSSTGRLDVFTRVITDESYRFDEIAAGYEGQLYLEVVPLSLLAAFAGLNFAGVPANLISMGAVDFGIIIDSAVVLVEALMVTLAMATFAVPTTRAPWVRSTLRSSSAAQTPPN